MIKPAVISVLLTFMTQIACIGPRNPEGSTTTGFTRIGIYDSRAIAIAFVGSEVYRTTAGKKMAEMMQERNKAEAEGNTQRIIELKTWKQTQQALRRRQVFSTASVDDILAHISDQLHGIKKAAKVDLLVSKWDKTTLDRNRQAKRVDVTMQIVAALKPKEKQKKMAIDIQKRDPVPLGKRTGCKHHGCRHPGCIRD